MTTEKDIVHEAGNFWVRRTQTGYRVMENVGCYSTCDGIEYPKDDDGLSIAKKYCDYRAEMRERKQNAN